MDTFLTLASLRAVRSYSGEPVLEETRARIINAGRLTGSAYNGQPWLFLVIQDRDVLEKAGECVNRPTNVSDASFCIAIVLEEDSTLTRFDAGRCAQNMMLTAWSEGVASSPNYVHDPARLREIVDLDGTPMFAAVLSFGYPDPPIDPHKQPVADWAGRADRKPEGDTVRFI